MPGAVARSSAGVSSTTEELREELRLQELINAEVQKRADLGFSSTPDLQEHLRMQEQINAEIRKQADLEARRLEGASKGRLHIVLRRFKSAARCFEIAAGRLESRR